MPFVVCARMQYQEALSHGWGLSGVLVWSGVEWRLQTSGVQKSEAEKSAVKEEVEYRFFKSD